MWTQLIDEWTAVLADLETDPARCADRLDWMAKKRLLDAYVNRDGLEWNDPKLRALDLQYHDIDPASGLYHRLVKRGAIKRLFGDDQVDDAVERSARRRPGRTSAGGASLNSLIRWLPRTGIRWSLTPAKRISSAFL